MKLETAALSSIRPVLEYAAQVWNPHTANNQYSEGQLVGRLAVGGILI